MLRPRLGTHLGTHFGATAAITATALLVSSAAAGAATPTGGGMKGIVEQQINGYTDACGPAPAVTVGAEMLARIGVGSVALYTGRNRTGTGCVVVTGDHQPIGTDFQIRGMTAASVANYTDEQQAVYSDTTDNLDAVVPPGAVADIPPVDVNFAAYPVGSTPPPDDRGLIPTAVFQFPS